MEPNGHPLLSLFLLALLNAPSHGQSPAGFVSIDCGIPKGAGYTDDETTLEFTSDEMYVKTGGNRNVPSSAFSVGRQYKTLRSFPTGVRNCYTLRPVEMGTKYLVRAGFLYGNYDHLNSPPVFDLHLGADLWQRVNTSSRDGSPVRTEIMALAPADSVSVCLVNIGSGVPFVSVIELRPLPPGIYPPVNASQSLVLFEDRRDFGGRPHGAIRYPDDPYDRLWFTPTNQAGWTNVSTGWSVGYQGFVDFQPPSAVMRTAVTTAAIAGRLDFSTKPSSRYDEIYVFLHFAELTQLGLNETREMDVYLNGDIWGRGFNPRYLRSGEMYTDIPGALDRYNFSIRASNRSTLPPILNAVEVYVLRRLEARPTETGNGFINIDCGIPGGTRSTDEEGITEFTSDEKYVETGENKNISSKFIVRQALKTLRSFPTGARNCYTLQPAQQGKKYLVRAGFFYGNYDGLNRPPVFDLHLGVNFWATVNTSTGVVRKEIIAVAPASSLSLCLVNKGSGVPFVSAIKLRPLPDEIYPQVNASQSLVLFQDRWDFGGRPNGAIRYPDDPYDRLWFHPLNTPVESTYLNTTDVGIDVFHTPPAVMKTAATTSTTSGSLNFGFVPSHPGEEIYVFMHFAELKLLGANETREMDVYLNGSLWDEGFALPYLSAGHIIYTASPGRLERYDFSIRASNRSTFPPFINGMEVFALNRVARLPTDSGDVDAILNIKDYYQIKRNWWGDPCVPQSFIWEGLNCTYDAMPRITSLNLTLSGLTGGIHASISNLTNITSLDLSKNNLTGEIPEFLAELQSLQLLNLSGNQLTGLVPQLLYERSLNGLLSLSVSDNPDLCYNKDSCQMKKNRKIFVPIIMATSITLVVLIGVILAWALKRRRYSSNQDNSLVPSMKEDGSSQFLNHKGRESQRFTYSEIINITNNFEKEIGRGGFGVVFYGCFNDGTQVAVKKLSKLSSQGKKEFKAEVLTLMRVHHKTLVPLLGYCDEKDNLALVYEYMAQGSLVDHLRAKASNCDSLSWRVRMRIALEAAQGLDYLHNGCKPPIIHRDVKAANILLNQNLEAKIADFGLSRAFTNEGHSHISTNTVAGTPGYVDPEYHRTFKLNEKSDVFSFGVVLLEIITGKPPILNGLERIHITDWVRPRLEMGDIDSIADPNFQGLYDQNSIWKAVEIAMLCTSSTSNERPTMNDVVIQLKECLTSDIASETYLLATHDAIKMIPANSGSVANPEAR